MSRIRSMKWRYLLCDQANLLCLVEHLPEDGGTAGEHNVPRPCIPYLGRR